MSAKKRLYRSRTNKAIWGVCGGLGDYFDLDPAFIRVAFVLLVFANGIGVIAYLVLALATPREPETQQGVETPPAQPPPGEGGLDIQVATDVRGRHRYLVGVVLVIVGLLFLMGNFGLFWWLSWGRLWPLALIGVGLAIIWARGAR
ncbi:MAG: PspC domain-containing protein [Chloroflexi bacterium]|nr:PspC domain-containing protein [Chloroflexota bacterium]